jgi:uncharacterized membrane protein
MLYKRKFGFLALFLFITHFIHADLASIFTAETPSIRTTFSSPRVINSNGKTLREFEISNNGTSTIHDLELLFTNDDGLEIKADKTKINKIDPKETIVTYVEITNNYKYYFDKETFIRIKIFNNEYSDNFAYKFTIKPVDNFWLSIIISISLILTVSFIIIFIRINKGDENVR